jgi:hypothetical protein
MRREQEVDGGRWPEEREEQSSRKDTYAGVGSNLTPVTALVPSL